MLKGILICKSVLVAATSKSRRLNKSARFFKIRNPLVCLLDPILHTSDNVRPLSFTLFSVICALGCAISGNQTDRSLYPTLLALAESNIKWSIATSVKSVETIQAIFTMEYWSPVHETQKDDPYWLHISHVRNCSTTSLIYN
jgi:hypothetical protein